MVTQTEYGKFVISAGEVGAYTVCPKSWELRAIQKVQFQQQAAAEQGQRLHKTWAKEVDKVATLHRSVRILLLLVSIMVLSALWLL